MACNTISKINKASLKSEAYSVINGALGNISKSGVSPTSATPGIQTGVTVTSGAPTTKATPSNVTGN